MTSSVNFIFLIPITIKSKLSSHWGLHPQAVPSPVCRTPESNKNHSTQSCVPDFYLILPFACYIIWHIIFSYDSNITFLFISIPVIIFNNSSHHINIKFRLCNFLYFLIRHSAFYTAHQKVFLFL